MIKNTDRLLELLNKRNWAGLSEIINHWETLNTLTDIIKYVHPFLAHNNVLNYLNWLATTTLPIKDLPISFLKHIIFQLVSKGHYS